MMSQKDYMDKLGRALEGFEKEIREEILSDYEEHFNMGLINGKTEEQICAELGEIDELVSELKDLERKSTTEADADAKQEAIADSIAKTFGALGAELCKMSERLAMGVMNKVDGFDNRKFTEGVEKAAESATESAQKMGAYASDFAKKIAESFNASMGEKKPFEDFNSRPAKKEAEPETTEESYSAAEDEITRIVIEADCADITVTTSEDNNCRFDYRNDGTRNQQLAYRFYHRQEGNTIYAGVEKRFTKTSYFDRISSADITLKVQIPNNLESLEIKTLSGDIDMSEVKVKRCKLMTVSGDIEVGTADGEDIDLNTMSGDMTIDDTSAQVFEIHAASGDVRISDGYLGNCNICLASGDASVESVEATVLIIESASGDVEIENSTVEKVAVKTASGDAELQLNSPKDLAVATISGDVEINLNDVTGYTAKVKTVSGDIELSCGEEERDDVKTGTYSMGSGETMIDVSTVNGDIEINA